MANDRLRAAMAEAGLTVDDLAERAEVDAKTVGRWLSGRTPRPRHRIAVAQILGRADRQLWPDAAVSPIRDDGRHEISAAYAHANDLTAPDWRALLRQARQQVELLGFSLIDVVGAGGVVDALGAKAESGCEVRILISAADSIWLTSAAQHLGQDEEDHVGQSALQREVELARGHLEPLLTRPHFALRRFYAERVNSILRIDDQMIVTLGLWGTPLSQAPMLHVRRVSDDGLFDQFAGHFDAIWRNASEPVDPNADLYPPPARAPERYAAVTEDLLTKENERLARAARLRKGAGGPPSQPRPPTG